MSTAEERYRALVRLPDSLVEFANRAGRVKKKELRRLVRQVLRHYPMTLELDQLADRSPAILRRMP